MKRRGFFRAIAGLAAGALALPLVPYRAVHRWRLKYRSSCEIPGGICVASCYEAVDGTGSATGHKITVNINGYVIEMDEHAKALDALARIAERT